MPRMIGFLHCYELEGSASVCLLGLHSACCRVSLPLACAPVLSTTTRGLSMLAALHCTTSSNLSKPRQRAYSHVTRAPAMVNAVGAQDRTPAVSRL